MTSFTDLGVRARTADSLRKKNINEPNKVQQDALPPLIAGNDCVIEAPTGSGKTLAFVIPMVERLSGHQGHGARALIITPTRELAVQIGTVVRSVDPMLRIAVCIGGVGYGTQISNLRNSPDVIIGCPGRTLDLATSGSARLNTVTYLVLDEADEMLDQGFAKDVEKLIAMCPKFGGPMSRQTVLASATMPSWVQQMITKHLNSPARVQVVNEQQPDVEHAVLQLARAQKIATLSTLLKRQKGHAVNQTIVFHRTKHGAKKLSVELQRLGHTTSELQGNMSQNARDRSLQAFRAKQTEVLVATNVAARGIDVVNVGMVINFELPDSPQWLTHRVGRTARNGTAGKAITFMSDEDAPQWGKLRRLGAAPLPAVDGGLLLSTGEWKVGPMVESTRPLAPMPPRGPRPSFNGGGSGSYGRRPRRP